MNSPETWQVGLFFNDNSDYFHRKLISSSSRKPETEILVIEKSVPIKKFVFPSRVRCFFPFFDSSKIEEIFTVLRIRSTVR